MSDGSVTCPRCPGHLVYDPEGRTTLYECPNCHGHWNGRFPVDANMTTAPTYARVAPALTPPRRRWRWPWQRTPTSATEPDVAAPTPPKRVNPFATVVRLRNEWTAGGRRAWAEMRVVGSIQHTDRRYNVMENGEWQRA